MSSPDFHLIAVVASMRADDLVAVHEATASVAYAHIFSEPFPREEARARWATHKGPAVIAQCDGVTIGFAAASPDGTLEALYVLPNEAGRGVGTALIAALGPVSRLWVLEKNIVARAFYERRGWCSSGMRRSALDAEGKPELLYVR